jgi:hypothetical protein
MLGRGTEEAWDVKEEMEEDTEGERRERGGEEREGGDRDLTFIFSAFFMVFL